MYNCKLWYLKTTVFQNCILKQTLVKKIKKDRIICVAAAAQRETEQVRPCLETHGFFNTMVFNVMTKL
jgi:hypothetical protein